MLMAAAGRIERWGTNQVRRAIERVSLRWLKTKINIQIWRHNSKATMRRYIKDSDILPFSERSCSSPIIVLALICPLASLF